MNFFTKQDKLKLILKRYLRIINRLFQKNNSKLTLIKTYEMNHK